MAALSCMQAPRTAHSASTSCGGCDMDAGMGGVVLWGTELLDCGPYGAATPASQEIVQGWAVMRFALEPLGVRFTGGLFAARIVG
ncbi:hypothetical protein GCM10009864_19840 [Streptomyces lunalinharesii]|uniref:Uncharacterized protein n=1 Tax=Streptomyces lunalinharesii TaxID=333384 RepID=A0ABN3RKC2_9ACTN